MKKYSIAKLYDYDFICSKMDKYGYDSDDYDVFKSMENICYSCSLDGIILAFGCITVSDNREYVTYTYSDGTYSGKKAYAKLCEYVLGIHHSLSFGEYAKKFNKTKEIINGKK